MQIKVVNTSRWFAREDHNRISRRARENAEKTLHRLIGFPVRLPLIYAIFYIR
jgi:hypothetical protein